MPSRCDISLPESVGLFKKVKDLLKNGGKDMVEIMTDRQYDGILQMIEMIVDSCKDLEEAKKKIAELRKEKKEKEKTE